MLTSDNRERLKGVSTATLTTAGDASVSPSLVTALTGTLNGTVLTFLAPDTYPFPAFPEISNDNLFLHLCTSLELMRTWSMKFYFNGREMG